MRSIKSKWPRQNFDSPWHQHTFHLDLTLTHQQTLFLRFAYSLKCSKLNISGSPIDEMRVVSQRASRVALRIEEQSGFKVSGQSGFQVSGLSKFEDRIGRDKGDLRSGGGMIVLFLSADWWSGYYKLMLSQGDLSKCVCTQDFRQYAKRLLPKAVFEYIDSGSEGEKTLRQNQTSFHKLMIIPRILISSEKVDMTTSVFGHSFALPFGFAPFAMNSICHPDGEIVAAAVAKQANIMWTLSSLSTKSFAELEKANGESVRLLQLYITKDWELTKTIIKLAEKYGFTGLCITVDAQVLGVRKRQKKASFDSSHLAFPVLEEIHDNCSNKSIPSTQRTALLANRDLSLNWETIRKIREITPLKIVLKGIMHPRDAQIAVNYCDAIYVSNHGGRQLDGVQATINVLPFIKSAVGNKLPIFVDGGVRTGNDIFKCLALGANYVFVGRPLAYSMVFGSDGVKKLVDILAQELRRCMILVGCKSLEDIRADAIVPQPSL